jgi:predicted patatin/cPLA2 family phospholipase
MKPAEVKQTLNDNKKIEEKIDSIRDTNNGLSEKIGQLEQNQQIFYDIINKNNMLIEQNNKELIKLKRLYNGKINNVSGYNVAQLDSFFTNRYKELYNR